MVLGGRVTFYYAPVAAVLMFAAMLLADPAWAQNIRLEKEESEDPVEVGETLTYDIVLTNTSSTNAATATVVDRLPEDVRLIGYDANYNAPCSRDRVDDREEITCEFAAITQDRPARVRIAVEPLETGEIRNRAEVPAASTNDSTPPDPVTISTQVEEADDNSNNGGGTNNITNNFNDGGGNSTSDDFASTTPTTSSTITRMRTI